MNERQIANELSKVSVFEPEPVRVFRGDGRGGVTVELIRSPAPVPRPVRFIPSFHRDGTRGPVIVVFDDQSNVIAAGDDIEAIKSLSCRPAGYGPRWKEKHT